MLAIAQYLAPRTLEEAARVLAGGGATALAGGTDLLPRWSKGLIASGPTVVDLKRIGTLRGIERADGEIRIGACTPLSDIAADAMLAALARPLAVAADRVACPQVRNRATIGGNLCNASPAADTAVPLILLDAVLELVAAGPQGLSRRRVPVADFFRGPGETVLAPGELLSAIRFPPLPDDIFACWDKFGTRRAMEIAVASVGVALRLRDGRVTAARIGYGSVAPVPLRGRQAEAVLVGRRLEPEAIAACVAAARAEIAPISDVRASAEYRRELVGVMLRRMLERASVRR